MEGHIHGSMKEIFKDIISEMGFIDVELANLKLEDIVKDFSYDIRIADQQTRIVVFFSKKLAEILFENIFAGCEGEGLLTEDAVKEFLNVFAGNLINKMDFGESFDLGIPKDIDPSKFDYDNYKFLFFSDVDENTVAVGHTLNILEE